MKLATTLACLAVVGMTSGAMAQPTTARPAPGSSATSNSGTVAKGVPDTSTGAGNPVAKPAPAASSAPAAAMAADQFKDEASAKSHCPSDSIVWVNLNSKAYHASGTKYYGKTKSGAYECMKDADTDGFHAAGHKKTAAAAPAK